MKKIVHVVPHSHWDREWYFTTSRSKIYLMHDLKRVLELLEESNGYDSFILDGQASLLDDYLNWRPQDRNKITKLVKQNRLIIGPWYTQTDQLVISGESIVRNMLYGTRICKEFGKYMNVAYVPDSFGQSSSMPQIYKEFNIEDTMFWRGVSDDEVSKTEFIWQGEDGSTVTAFQIPSGYYIGGNIPEDKKRLSTFLNEDPIKKTWSRSSTNQVYFPNGFDQAPARENLPELIDKMNDIYDDQFELKISSIEEYINSVKSRHPELEEITGELTNGKLMRIHKSIFSSRPDLKKLNTQIQFYIVNILEPVLVMAESLNIEYPVETVKEIWKLMFENAAHDSIGSCVSDTTNEDVYMRYKQVKDVSSNLVEITLRQISSRVNNTDAKEITLTLFNTLNTSRSKVFETDIYIPSKQIAIYDENGKEVEYSLLEVIDQTSYILNQGNVLDGWKKIYIPETVYKARIAIKPNDIPSLGYVQYTIDLKGSTNSEVKQSSNNYLENKFYKIVIENNGSLTILDKKSGHVYKNQGILEENGDDGDSFNYSPPINDLIIKSTDFFKDFSIIKSDVIEVSKLKFNLLVPKNLEERSKKIQSTSLPITMTIKLTPDEPVISFSLIVDNRHVDSHRVCVLFDTEIKSNVSIADHQFGLLKRPVELIKELTLWEKDKTNWNEKPISIETCQSFVNLSDNSRGVSIMPQGVREYEIVGNDFSVIRLTIFRTYGFMGKENLLYRPGRASGETVVETPAAQCHKLMTFDFGAYFYKGSFNSSKTSNYAKEFNTPIQTYQLADFLNTRLRFTLSKVSKDLSTKYSLLKTDNRLIMSVIKKSEEREGYIIRLYNGLLHNEVDDWITFNKNVKKAEYVNLLEEKKSDILVKDNKIYLESVGHSKFVTIYIEF